MTNTDPKIPPSPFHYKIRKYNFQKEHPIFISNAFEVPLIEGVPIHVSLFQGVPIVIIEVSLFQSVLVLIINPPIYESVAAEGTEKWCGKWKKIIQKNEQKPNSLTRSVFREMNSNIAALMSISLSLCMCIIIRLFNLSCFIVVRR